MGVSNFKELLKIRDFLSCWEEVKIEKVDVIIDGNALYYFLYFNSDPKLDQRCGGDYPGFKDEVCKFFHTLQDCGVTPYVILDGASDPDKHKTDVSRLGDKLKKAKQIENGGTLPKKCDVLPPLVKDVFIEILREKGIKFKVCLGEADPEVVSEANQKKCAVLSGDTDFCIYKLHNGFLHLDNFLWKNKEDGKIPAKLYRRSKFCKLFKLDPTLMPVFASLAGNDYFKFKFNLEDIPAHENERKLGKKIKILDRMLCILSDVKLKGLTHSEKISRALDYLKDSEILQKFSEEENQKFKTSIEKYEKLETQNTSSNLPSWVCKKVEDGTLTSFVVSVVDQKTMMLTPLVEDFSQESSYTAASCIRQYFYELLTGDKIAEYDRERKEIKCKFVRPTLLSSDKDNPLEQLENKGLKEFEAVLQVQKSDLKNIPDHLKLPVCVTDFWFKRVQHPPNLKTVNCLHALLLWFLYEPSCPEGEFEKKMKALKDEGVSNWQPRVAHAFSQWQCCMRQSLHLNQLLCSPLPEPQCARLYCGPLLHRLADEDIIKQLQKTLHGQKKEIYKNLKTILNLKPFLNHSKSTGEGSSSEEECQQLQTTEEEENSDEDLITSLDNLHIVETNLVIGDSALRNVQLKTPGTMIKCIPEATAPVIEAELKLLAKRRFRKIVIHVGSNDIQLQQFEDSKNSIASVCNFARTMSDAVAFSGPFPNETMLSLNCWLSEWCSENSVVFIDNWQTFSESPGLIEEDGIHPTLDGAALLSRHLDEFFKLKPESRVRVLHTHL